MANPDPLNANRRRVRRRRHGYRGYGSPLRGEQGGFVHWGRGFTGVEFPGDTVGLGTRRGFLPEPLRIEGGHSNVPTDASSAGRCDQEIDTIASSLEPR